MHINKRIWERPVFRAQICYITLKLFFGEGAIFRLAIFCESTIPEFVSIKCISDNVDSIEFDDNYYILWDKRSLLYVPRVWSFEDSNEQHDELSSSSQLQSSRGGFDYLHPSTVIWQTLCERFSSCLYFDRCPIFYNSISGFCCDYFIVLNYSSLAGLLSNYLFQS